MKSFSDATFFWCIPIIPNSLRDLLRILSIVLDKQRVTLYGPVET